MKVVTYEVTVKKTMVLTQTYRIGATSRLEAVDAALGLASDLNAETHDTDWKLVRATKESK